MIRSGRMICWTAVWLAAACPVAIAAGPQDSTTWRWVGSGVQIYDCVESDNKRAWKLVGPDALLTDPAGHVRGHHGIGPTWQASDGSIVRGSVIETIASPSPNAVPWLVLSAREHTGIGIMDHVALVLRLNTEGGLPPVEGCGATGAARQQVRIPYRAIYLFVSEASALRPPLPGG